MPKSLHKEIGRILPELETRELVELDECYTHVTLLLSMILDHAQDLKQQNEDQTTLRNFLSEFNDVMNQAEIERILKEDIDFREEHLILFATHLHMIFKICAQMKLSSAYLLANEMSIAITKLLIQRPIPPELTHKVRKINLFPSLPSYLNLFEN
jgi:hypothetical protein